LICTFSVDVLHDGTPAAQFTLEGEVSCPEATLECLSSGCQIVCGKVLVVDNGQQIGTIPAGESVETGIVGTTYTARRFIDEDGNDVFEATCEEGAVTYTFHLADGSDLTVVLGPTTDECPDCQEEGVVVNLTTDEQIAEPAPDNDSADEGTATESVPEAVPDEAEPTPDVVEPEPGEPDPEVIDDTTPTDNGTPDVPPVDVNPADVHTDPSTPDVVNDNGCECGEEVASDTSFTPPDCMSCPDARPDSTQPDEDTGGGGGGNCSMSSGTSDSQWGAFVFALIAVAILLLRRRRN
jgi:MYXO-CTERM domain-containing protein